MFFFTVDQSVFVQYSTAKKVFKVGSEYGYGSTLRKKPDPDLR